MNKLDRHRRQAKASEKELETWKVQSKINGKNKCPRVITIEEEIRVST